ncbi:hypothetical protein Hanom_Chr00s002917g01706801 [Helianthus anomalus]
MFAGVLRNLGVDHEEKEPKRVVNKIVTVAGETATKKAETAGAASDVASRKGGKPQGNVAAGTQSSGSAGSKGPESGATPISAHVKETEVDPGHVELIMKNSSKRSGEEKKSEASPATKNIATGKPTIGKKGSLRTLYTNVSTGKCSHTCTPFYLFAFGLCLTYFLY